MQIFVSIDDNNDCDTPSIRSNKELVGWGGLVALLFQVVAHLERLFVLWWLEGR